MSVSHLKEFCKEALLWRQLRHQNILSFLGVDKDTFAATNALCMVSPWMAHGTIMTFINSNVYELASDRDRLVSFLRVLKEPQI